MDLYNEARTNLNKFHDRSGWLELNWKHFVSLGMTECSKHRKIANTSKRLCVHLLKVLYQFHLDVLGYNILYLANLKLTGRYFSFLSSFIKPKAYLWHVGRRPIIANILNKVGPTSPQGSRGEHVIFDSIRERNPWVKGYQEKWGLAYTVA